LIFEDSPGLLLQSEYELARVLVQACQSSKLLLDLCRENMQELGMEGVSGDIITAKHKIQDKYLETEFQVGYPYVCHMLFQGSFVVFLLRY
jgi:hypothetical protein